MIKKNNFRDSFGDSLYFFPLKIGLITFFIFEHSNIMIVQFEDYFSIVQIGSLNMLTWCLHDPVAHAVAIFLLT